MSRDRRAVAAAILLLVSGALAGTIIRPDRVDYRLFGLTEGIFALFLLYLLIQRGIWRRMSGPLAWLPLVYGLWGTAQLLELLFPPPGILEWMVVPALVVALWGAVVSGASRERLLASIAGTAVLLALLTFSVVPTLWSTAEGATDTGFGIGGLASGMRQLVVAHEPVSPATHLLGVLAIALWGVATRLLWPPST